MGEQDKWYVIQGREDKRTYGNYYLRSGTLPKVLPNGNIQWLENTQWLEIDFRKDRPYRDADLKLRLTGLGLNDDIATLRPDTKEFLSLLRGNTSISVALMPFNQPSASARLMLRTEARLQFVVARRC
jgi:hypothetical protein